MTQHIFLVEIGTEELPPKILRTLAEAFSSYISSELNIANVCHGNVNWFATPRRLAVKVSALSSIQNESNIEKRGPATLLAFDADGNPTKIARSWARDCGITINQAECLTNDKGKWLVYRTRISGQPVYNLLHDIVIRALNKLPIQKRMRWGNNKNQFIRPVHTVTLLLDDRVVTGNVLGVEANRIVCGHRFMGKQKIQLDHANQYSQALLNHGRVIADYLQRKEIIRRNVEVAAKQLDGIADLNENLLEEVTSLVEWPVVFTAHFEEKFLAMPAEILVYIMKNDKKYFPIYDSKGNLLPHFIFVVNIESKDPQQIIIGHERVIHSCLVDAEFFFNTDRKQRLEDRLPRLNLVVFQKQLGTLRNKCERIQCLAAWVASQIGADVSQAARAGLLSKCDLVTNMVSEFTETQGVMGMYYARHDGEPEAVALAQKEQYQPRFSGDTLPTTLVSCAVAIADKMDTLAGIFNIGYYPKGGKDPFALRRTALGMLRIILEKQLPLDLQALTEKAVLFYSKNLINKTIVNDIINFIFNRLRFWYQEQGYSVNIIQAVLARRPTRPSDFDARIRAVNYFHTLEEAASLAVANKRVSNILAKSNDPIREDLQISMLKDPAEIVLATHLVVLREKLQVLFRSGRYQDALIELATLREPVDAFFNNVVIMVDDPHVRINRLALLVQLRKLFLQVADISMLQ